MKNSPKIGMVNLISNNEHDFLEKKWCLECRHLSSINLWISVNPINGCAQKKNTHTHMQK